MKGELHGLLGNLNFCFAKFTLAISFEKLIHLSSHLKDQRDDAADQAEKDAQEDVENPVAQEGPAAQEDPENLGEKEDQEMMGKGDREVPGDRVEDQENQGRNMDTIAKDITNSTILNQ